LRDRLQPPARLYRVDESRARDVLCRRDVWDGADGILPWIRRPPGHRDWAARQHRGGAGDRVDHLAHDGGLIPDRDDDVRPSLLSGHAVFQPDHRGRPRARAGRASASPASGAAHAQPGAAWGEVQRGACRLHRLRPVGPVAGALAGRASAGRHSRKRGTGAPDRGRRRTGDPDYALPAGHHGCRPGKVAAMGPVSPLLETVNLEKWFGGLRAVHSVDFRLERGEIRAIIGPNGAGKTTFVSMICGRIPPTSGRVIFKGREITRVPAHARVGLGFAYTFQLVSIFRNLTVYENVALAVQRRLVRHSLDAIKDNPRALTAEVEGALAEV